MTTVQRARTMGAPTTMAAPPFKTMGAITKIDPNQALKRMSISGQVTLQRKTYWVTRYAEIKDSYFSYKRDASK